MRKSTFFGHLKLFFLILFLPFIAFSQNRPKLDRNFSLLYSNRAVLNDESLNMDGAAEKIDPKITKEGKVLYSCIIYTDNPAAVKAKGILVQSTFKKFVTALVSIKDLEVLMAMPEVIYVQTPKEIPINNDISVAATGADLLQNGSLNNTKYTGKGVLVGILDTGIDWKHPDFRDVSNQNRSRIVKLWDQMITPKSTENSPSGFNYGVEYTQDQISAELATGATVGLIRTLDESGHGTHVAGTAAGNGYALFSGATYTLEGAKYKGLAPEAEYVIVRGASTGGFSQTNVINSLTYFKNVANSLNRPIVVNMSIGGQATGHDGTDTQEIAVDDFTSSGPGRIVAIAGGNDNTANLHKRDVITAGATATTSFVVPTNTSATSILGYLAYVNDSSPVDAVFKDPNGNVINIPLNSDTGNTGNKINNDSFIVYAENYVDPANGKRYVYVSVSRVSGNTTDAKGTWTLEITNKSASTITVDGWLYSNKSGLVLTGGDSNYVISSPGSATSAVTVAAYAAKIFWYSNSTTTPGGYSYAYKSDDIAPFSNVGPRIDAVQKPDIAAPGVAVASALASNMYVPTANDNVDAKYYVVKNGTSMATPAVTGGIALLLQMNPAATVDKIKTALYIGAQSDAITGPVPNPTWGYGKMDVFQSATSMAGTMLKRRTFINEPLPYTASTDGSSALNTQRIAESFTTDISGILGGVYVHTVSVAGAGGTFNLTGLTVEIRKSEGGKPGALLGSKSVDPTYISKFSWNYIQLADLKIPVTKDSDFFVVMYAADGSKWGVRRFTPNTGGRSQISTDNGTTWTADNVGYRIRSVVLQTLASLATSENQLTEAGIVYPNPTSETLFAKLPFGGKSDVKIYDMSGRLVKQISANSKNIELYVGNLAAGTYTLSVTSAEGKMSRKFVKK